MQHPRRPEAGLQQSHRMQILNPLAVRHVTFAARNIRCVLRIYKKYLEATRLKNLIERNPIYAGRLHRHCLHPALLQPAGQFVQVAGKRPERSHRIRVTLCRDCDKDLFSAYIHARRIRMHHLQHPATRLSFTLALPGHLSLPLLGPAARGYESSKLLNGIAAVADVITDLYVTSNHPLPPRSSSSNLTPALSLPHD